MASKHRPVVSYARDMQNRTDKFRELDRLASEASTTDVDAVMIHAPQVLGDTYDELITNLNKLADAELSLTIVPSSRRGN